MQVKFLIVVTDITKFDDILQNLITHPMKKLLLSTAIVLSILVSFTSCKKDNNNSQNSTIPIQYKMETSMFPTTGMPTPQPISSCFHYNISYVNAKGESVNVNNVNPGWTAASFDVKSPFTAKIEGTIIYNESELPDGTIVFGGIPVIYYTQNGVQRHTQDDITKTFSSKSQFLDYIATHQDKLHFKAEIAL